MNTIEKRIEELFHNVKCEEVYTFFGYEYTWFTAYLIDTNTKTKFSVLVREDNEDNLTSYGPSAMAGAVCGMVADLVDG